MMFRFIRRRSVLLGALCFLIVCLIFVPQMAFAVDVGEGVREGVLAVVNVVVGAVMWGFEFILGLTQYLFLQIVEFTILDFAKHWDGGFLSDFRVVWQVLRDFVNLVIVVFFVVTAMVTTLDNGQFGFHRKGLLYLIAAAVVVNFSAFLTLLVIDISHILFMLVFNALDASSWATFSPFSSEYSNVLGDVGTGAFNLIVGVIAIVVNWFIVLGLLYFCIILIERYIIAVFLVVLSPLAALGFFANMSGGSPLTSKFVGVYEQWSERLGYVFSMPVVLILGFTLLLVLFRGALGQASDPGNFVTLIGLGNAEGRGILLTLVMASIVLIFGIFKVGEMAKKANIHHTLAGKFKFGELASKLVKPKAPIGLLRSLRNPAGKAFGLKQKVYNQRDKWRREGSPLANIPGIGKPLDVGGKVRRTRQRARAIAKGVGAVGDGVSARETSFQSVEAGEDKRISDIILHGSQDQKRDLLKQALDPKDNTTLNEQQTAKLAQNTDLHVELSQLKEGVSQSTFRRIHQDAKRKGKEIAKQESEIADEKSTFSDDYKTKEQARDAAVAEFEEMKSSRESLQEQERIVRDKYDEEMDSLQQEKKLLQDEYEKADEFFQSEKKSLQDEYDKKKKIFEQELRDKQFELGRFQATGNAGGAAKVEKDIEDLKNGFSAVTVSDPDDSNLQEKRVALQEIERKSEEVREKYDPGLQKMKDALEKAEAETKKADSRQKRSEKEFSVVANERKNDFDEKEGDIAEDRKEVAQILSNVAANTVAGSVSGDAAKQFDPDTLAEVREQREEMTARTQDDFAAMNDGYGQSSSVAEEMLDQEQTSLKEEDKKGNAELADKKSAYYEEQAKNPDPAVITQPMQQLQQEIDTLNKAAADRRARSLEIDKQKGRIKEIRDALNDQDATDAQKIETLGQATSHAASFMQDGTKYLDDQLQDVNTKITEFEAEAEKEGTDLDSSPDYQDLLQEQSQVNERLGKMSKIGEKMNSVKDSLDEQRQILASPAYQKLFDQERYLNLFTLETLLRDVSSALDTRKKEFEEEYKKGQEKKTGTAKKPSKDAYKKDPKWKELDQWKKNLTKIQKEGGTSAELRKKAIEEAKKATSKKKK